MLEPERGGSGGRYGLGLGVGRAVSGVRKKVYGGFSSGSLEPGMMSWFSTCKLSTPSFPAASV